MEIKFAVKGNKDDIDTFSYSRYEDALSKAPRKEAEMKNNGEL